MLTKEQIQTNKEEFIEILRTIEREGAEIEKLITKLENSDFFYAPASIKYHNAFEGGLVDHCLNVYYNLMHLLKYKYPDGSDISDDSIKIVALLHDLSKMNNYEPTYSNKKVYCEEGNKYDELGKFMWVSVPSWKVREASDRFIFGNHESTAEFMIRQFIPLTVEESSAILHHMGGMSWDSAKDNISEVYNKYPLGVMLHTADMLSTYIDERI
jgi:hypothetical protein